MTDNSEILNSIKSKVLEYSNSNKGNYKGIELNDAIKKFIINAKLSDIKPLFESLNRFDKMTFRNSVYMSTLCSVEVLDEKKTRARGKPVYIIPEKPNFTDDQMNIISYMNRFAGIKTLQEMKADEEEANLQAALRIQNGEQY